MEAPISDWANIWRESFVYRFSDICMAGVLALARGGNAVHKKAAKENVPSFLAKVEFYRAKWVIAGRPEGGKENARVKEWAMTCDNMDLLEKSMQWERRLATAPDGMYS